MRNQPSLLEARNYPSALVMMGTSVSRWRGCAKVESVFLETPRQLLSTSWSAGMVCRCIASHDAWLGLILWLKQPFGLCEMHSSVGVGSGASIVVYASNLSTLSLPYATCNSC
jgi:hypothetical protein